MNENNYIPELDEYSAACLHPELIGGLNFEEEHANNDEENLHRDNDKEMDHPFSHSHIKSP